MERYPNFRIQTFSSRKVENRTKGLSRNTARIAAVVDLACVCANYAPGIFLVEAFLLVQQGAKR